MRSVSYYSRRTAGVWVLVVMPLLAACGSDSGNDPSPTAVPSPTLTATASPTATLTPVPTLTPTLVPTGTHTFSPVPTLTMTPQSTATATPTSTATASVTASPTATPSQTAPPTATSSPSPSPSPTPDVFTLHSSVEQLYVTGAIPGSELDLTAADGSPVATGNADTNGTIIFRDLTPAPGYQVTEKSGSTVVVSAPASVKAAEDVPPDSFYSQQQIGAGYQYLTTRDGTKLAINVYMPTGAGPFPTVIEYSGYDPANPDSPQPSTLITSTIGYAAVGINMRGTGCSGGTFSYFETLQSTDGYDAIETIAAQPWVKNHKVGMVGISYPGISQLFVAQTQPPHLAAIAPLSVISDSALGILYPGGILNNGFAIDWTKDRQHDAMPGGQPWSQKRIDDGDQVCIENQKLRGQTPDMLALIYSNNYYDPKISDPLAPVKFVHKINVPVFLAGAWQDEQTGGYFPTMLDQFTGTDKLHFTITNGDHVDSLGDPAIFTRWTEFLSFYVAGKIPRFPALGPTIIQELAQMVFGVPNLTFEHDRFTNAPSFDAALAQYEAEPKVRILFENGAGVPSQPGGPVPTFEKSFAAWPIPGVQPTIWYFADQGRLDSAAPTGAGADSYIYDPSRSQLVTIDSSDQGDVWKANAPWNWRQLDAGKALSYATDALSDTVVMIGSGSVDLWLQSTAKDTDLQVTLTEIRPDGQEVYVQNGWLRASERKLNDAASSVLRPVQTHLQADAADLPAGEFVLTRVELFPFAHVFRAGSRVRVTIEGPGAERPAWKFDALPTDAEVVNTVAHSVAAPSRIVLPVVPGIGAEAPAALPPCPDGLRGQPCRPYQDFTNTAG